MNHIRVYKSDLSFRLLRFIVVSGWVMGVVLPLLIVFTYAFNVEQAVKSMSFDALFSSFAWLFDHVDMGTGFKNSLLRSIVTPFFTCAICFAASYALAMRRTLGAKTIYAFFVLSLYFIVGPLFSYMNMSILSLTGTFWPYVLPYLSNSLYIIILIISVREIPAELAESARVCGAGELRIAFFIYLPNLLPRLAAIYVLCFITHWNNYIDTLLYNFSHTGLYTLQYMSHAYLHNTISSTSQHGSLMTASLTSVRMAMTVLLIIPILILVPVFKKSIVDLLKKN